MIMTRLQAFTRARQARLFLWVDCLSKVLLASPLLAGACEKFFHVLEVDDIGMVDVTKVINGDPPHSN
jgi:hypothetical protein